MERVLKHATLVDNKCGADNTHHGLPIHGFLAKSPIGVVNAQVLIAQQGEPQVLILPKLLKRRMFVLGDTLHDIAGSLQ